MSKHYSAGSTFQTYDEFVNTNDPFDLMGEIAGMRTLAVEFRKSLEDQGLARVQEFYQDVAHAFKSMVQLWAYRFPGFPEEIIDEAEKTLLNVVQQAHGNLFPVQTHLSAKDAEVMSKLLRNIVESSEKYKKIFDGITIGLVRDGDTDRMLQDLICNVILPNIPIQSRMDVAAACEAWFKKIPSQRSLVAARVIDAQAS